MKLKRLPRSFFIRPTLKVAKELLGKYLVRKIGDKTLIGKIVETEAYIGPEDRASHAYRGKITERCKTEYLEGGHIYIYLCYGMYWQLNITTEKEGKPECVLIRALETLESEPQNKKLKIPPSLKLRPSADEVAFDRRSRRASKNKKQILKIKKLTSGPGKLCRWLKLDKSFNGEDLVKSKRVWIEDPAPERARCGASRGEKPKKFKIVATTRIGIDYAGSWAKKPWRFYIKDNPFVSRK